MSDADLDRIEQAQIFADRFAPQDLAGIAVVLRFGATLRDEELPAVIEFGASKEGRVLAFPLQAVLVPRDRMDGVARLTTAAMLDVPRENRAYATWKSWEYLFGHREDFFRLSHAFTLALLQRFEHGDEQERQVVQDLLNEPDLTRERIPHLRAAADARLQEMTARMAAEEVPAQREKIRIEDRKGLREVAAKDVHHLDRFEVRLRTGAEVPWGVLMSGDTVEPEDVLTKLTVLRQLAASAHDHGSDLGAGDGPIGVVLGDSEPYELLDRIFALDRHVTLALATAALLHARIEWELPADAARAERAVATAKALLAAVRSGARRLRELTTAAARTAPPDEVGDAPVLRTLRDVTAAAMSWFLELAAAVPAPAVDAGWRDMRIARDQGRERTRVWIEADTVRVVIVDASERPSDVPGTTHGVRWFTFGREDLREAQFGTGESVVTVAPSRPVSIVFADSYPSSGCVRGGCSPWVWIPCDSEAHRDELIAALRRFAAGEAR